MSEKSEIDARIVHAQSVCDTEIDGVLSLRKSLGKDFVAAVDALLATKGRIIVSGMGKSGHIGRKIAATLASTGTPAYFVHPAEANHGDLGMITSDDALLILSNSGETRELSGLLRYARRYSLPIVAFTQSAQSTLSHYSHVVLLIPQAPEACPNGLAPTTSTTQMLVLGDALALALLKERGFSQDDFHVFHPGGELGRKLSYVKGYMRTEMPLCVETTPMPDVLATISLYNYGCAGICDAQGALIGIITDGDVRRHINGDVLNKVAADIMTISPKVVAEDALIEDALNMMNAGRITCLFIVNKAGSPRGIIHMHDCLQVGSGV